MVVILERQKTYHIAGPVNAEEVRDGQVQADGVAAGLSQHSLWKTGRAAGVDDVDGVCRLDGHARSPHAAGAGALDQVLPLPLALQLADGPPGELVALPGLGKPLRAG